MEIDNELTYEESESSYYISDFDDRSDSKYPK